MTCTCVSTIMADLLFVVPLGMSIRAAAPARNRRCYIRTRRRYIRPYARATFSPTIPRRLRHRLDHFAQLLEVIPRMVGMRVVARPEKLVLAHERHQPRDRPFVRVSRNEAL